MDQARVDRGGGPLTLRNSRTGALPSTAQSRVAHTSPRRVKTKDNALFAVSSALCWYIGASERRVKRLPMAPHVSGGEEGIRLDPAATPLRGGQRRSGGTPQPPVEVVAATTPPSPSVCTFPRQRASETTHKSSQARTRTGTKKSQAQVTLLTVLRRRGELRPERRRRLPAVGAGGPRPPAEICPAHAGSRGRRRHGP